MVKLRPMPQGMHRAVLASAAACLFLLQTLAFTFPADGRLAHAWGGAGASAAMAGGICRAAQDDGGKSPAAPAHPSPCVHCILCTAGAHDPALNALALLANVFVLLSPRLDGAPAWPNCEKRALWPPGSTSAWLSGVPPPVS